VRDWVAALTPHLPARDMLLAVPNGTRAPAALARPESDHPLAWVCSGTACQPPVAEWGALLA
jgi:uncharacterized protein YyaL (SSP411 family)